MTSTTSTGQCVATRHVRRLVAALTCASALVACGPGPSGDGPGPTLAEPTTSVTSRSVAPEGTTEPSPSASVRVSDALGRATTVTAPGGAAAPEVALVDGVVVVSATLGDGEALEVTVDDARWTAYPDGSATLTDAADPPRVGGTDPSARDADGVRRVSTRTEDDGRRLVVEVAARASASSTTAAPPANVTLTVAPRAVESATWADDVEGGRSLQVDPTTFGRSGSAAALEAVRAELVASGPDATTTVMDHQLRCHALGAPGKETWNLEPWRPEVDYLAYLLARCNPT